jgi:hypothetical protein
MGEAFLVFCFLFVFYLTHDALLSQVIAMTVSRLHALLAQEIVKGNSDLEVMVDKTTFRHPLEDDGAVIIPVESGTEAKVLLKSCSIFHREEAEKWKSTRIYKERNNLGPPQSKEAERTHYDWAIACEEVAEII